MARPRRAPLGSRFTRGDAQAADAGDGQVLVAYHRPLHFKDAATVWEHIHAFRNHSQYPVWEINLARGFPEGLWRTRPRAVILHYTLFGSGHYLLGPELERWLLDTDAITVAFFQDEHTFCRKRFDFVERFGIDHVFTHIDPSNWDRTWHEHCPRTTPHFNIPGYVATELMQGARRFSQPLERRDIDVGYRGRALPLWMGAGGQEKRVIGERFGELAAGSGLRLDIATDEASRLYGDDWFRFLGRCRAVLGVESGTSFIDIADEVHTDYHQRLADGRPVTLEALRDGALGRWDGNIPYRTLGPRHFEAAAFHNLQVMFEGEYSGVLRPMEHYIPLARDFSNVADVIALLRDPAVHARLTENAHRDLIRSGRFTYAAFVAGVDDVLRTSGLGDPAPPSSQRRQSSAIAAGRLARIARSERAHVEPKVRRLVYRIVAPPSRRIRSALGLPARE